MKRTPVSLAILAAVALHAATAGAMGAVVGKQGEVVGASSVRMAVATSPAHTIRWAQVSVLGASAGFVWLVPVHPGAHVDLASDAWLDALDAATTPVVLPPPAPPGCDQPLTPARVPPVSSPASVGPGQTQVLFDRTSLDAFVTGAGYAVPDAIDAGLGAVFAEGDAVAALVYASAGTPARTLRIVDGSAPSLPLALDASPLGDVPVTAFLVAATRLDAGRAPMLLDPTTVLWQPDAVSSYVDARTRLLEQAGGDGWITENTMPGIVFGGASDETGTATALPAVLDEYFTLAAQYGDATGDPATCAAAAKATTTDPSSYVATCPPVASALAILPGGDPCTPAAGGGIAVDSFLCGATGNATADDAALAVGGLSPQEIWITRVAGLVTVSAASDVPLLASVATPVSAFLTAGGFGSDCSSAGAAPPAGGGGGSSTSSGAPGNSSSASTAADVADTGCAALGAGADSCGGDSTDSTDSGSDSSSCDSTSGGGDSSSGGCSGGDSSSGGDCTTAPRAHRRAHSPVSRAAMLFAMAAILARRASRPRL